MKGIILAGGKGTRLLPMTKITNKHLLPIYNEPMIMFPLKRLINLGIKDIMIVSGKGHAGHFLELLGSGHELGIRLSYSVQEESLGIADALKITEDFADGEKIAVILGDNIYENDFEIKDFKEGARIFLKEVNNPNRFGVATLNGNKVIKIIEKPTNPETNYAVTGFYLFDETVYDKIRKLKISDRGEYEITDINNMYIKENKLDYKKIEGFWSDAGTIESLFIASEFIRNHEKRKM
ncbi:MAG: sugar phosphate nucleotidyltransferase [Methanobacterium sp.]|nr:sugar phosphate nucleotidyltransferase [Methanobacterium sp.]